MMCTKQVRLIFAGLSAMLAILLPQTKWSPPPESLRIGPVQYDNSISVPRRIPLGNTSAMNPTDVTISLRFVVRERPVDFAYLLSTSDGEGEGLKVSIDLYGNLYLSADLTGTTTGDYQLVKLSDPTPPGTEHNLNIKINTNQSWMEIKLDGKQVPVVEPRPLRRFDIAAVRPVIDLVEVGGMDDHNLSGSISGLNMVFGRSNPRIDTVNIKILLMLFAFGLLASTVGRNRAEDA